MDVPAIDTVQIPVFPDCSHPDSVGRACRLGVCARSERWRREGVVFPSVYAFKAGDRIRDVYFLEEYVVEREGTARKPWKLRVVKEGLREWPKVGEVHDDYGSNPRYILVEAEHA